MGWSIKVFGRKFSIQNFFSNFDVETGSSLLALAYSHGEVVFDNFDHLVTEIVLNNKFKVLMQENHEFFQRKLSSNFSWNPTNADEFQTRFNTHLISTFPFRIM
jgi:hypothetical protein